MIISFGWKASLVTGFNVNHRYRNADPADLPPGVTADHPAALRSISWVGAPFWAMRRAMPTRPLCPLKNSQSARPATMAIEFTRRVI